jgi:hypothetical protein
MLVGRSKGRSLWPGRIILKWMLRKYGVKVWDEFKWLTIRPFVNEEIELRVL